MHLAGQEVLWCPSLARGEAIELCHHGFPLEREIERREAFPRVPTTAMQARSRPRERMSILSDVTERLGGDRVVPEGIDPCQELAVEHPLA
jgi:hypothetical protein